MQIGESWGPCCLLLLNPSLADKIPIIRNKDIGFNKEPTHRRPPRTRSNMNASRIEGNRMNVSLLWVSGNKLWTVQKKLANGNVRVRCTYRRQQHCRAMGTLQQDVETINEIAGHTCDIGEDDVSTLRLKSAVKCALVVHNLDLRATYTNIAEGYTQAARDKDPSDQFQ